MTTDKAKPVQERIASLFGQSAHLWEGAGGTSPAAIRTSDVAAALGAVARDHGRIAALVLETHYGSTLAHERELSKAWGIAGQCLAARPAPGGADQVRRRLGHPAGGPAPRTRRPCTPVRVPAVLPPRSTPDPGRRCPPVADGNPRRRPRSVQAPAARSRRRTGRKRAAKQGLTRDRISPLFSPASIEASARKPGAFSFQRIGAARLVGLISRRSSVQIGHPPPVGPRRPALYPCGRMPGRQFRNARHVRTRTRRSADQALGVVLPARIPGPGRAATRGPSVGAPPAPASSGHAGTQAQADDRPAHDVDRFMRGVQSCLRRPAADNELGAMVSLAYNIGVENSARRPCFSCSTPATRKARRSSSTAGTSRLAMCCAG